MARIHDRMPLFLSGEELDRWLCASPDRVRDLLDRPPEIGLEASPVSRAVNNPRNDGPELIAPVMD